MSIQLTLLAEEILTQINITNSTSSLYNHLWRCLVLVGLL